MADVITNISTYAGLQTWADTIGTGSGYNDGDVAVGRVTTDLSGSSANALIFPAKAASPNAIASARLEPSPGSEHNGVPGAGIVIENTLGTGVIVAILDAVDYPIEIRDLEFFKNVTSGINYRNYAIQVSHTGSTHRMTMKRLLVHGTTYACADTYTPGGIGGAATNLLTVIRSQVYGFNNPTSGKGRGISQADIVHDCGVYNCADVGIYNNYAGTFLRNGIAMGCGTDCYGQGGWGAGTDKNMSSDATAPGATNYHNEISTDIWTDPVNGDFTTKPGTNARGTGDNLGSTYDENVDIENDVVTGAWDLGAYQHPGLLSGIPCTAPIQSNMIGLG